MSRTATRAAFRGAVVYRERQTEEIMASLRSIARSLERQMLSYVSKFSTTDGKFTGSKLDLARLVNARNEINRMLVQSGYPGLAADFVQKSFPELQRRVESAWNEAGFPASMTTLSQTAIDVASGAVLDQFANIGARGADELRRGLVRSVTGGTNWDDWAEGLRRTLYGQANLKDKRGLGMFVHAGTLARTAIDQVDRLVGKKLGEAADIEFYEYFGGIIETTRPFCEERNGQVFHIEEINRMDNGQIPDVFIAGGGYNCRHEWLPVLLADVPQEVLDRVAEAGIAIGQPSDEDIKASAAIQEPPTLPEEEMTAAEAKAAAEEYLAARPELPPSISQAEAKARMEAESLAGLPGMSAEELAAREALAGTAITEQPPLPGTIEAPADDREFFLSKFTDTERERLQGYLDKLDQTDNEDIQQMRDRLLESVRYLPDSFFDEFQGSRSVPTAFYQLSEAADEAAQIAMGAGDEIDFLGRMEEAAKIMRLVREIELPARLVGATPQQIEAMLAKSDEIAAKYPDSDRVSLSNDSYEWRDAIDAEIPEAWAESVRNQINGTHDKAIALRIDDEGSLASVIRDGRIKSQFETGTSNGYMGFEARADAEFGLFDYPRAMRFDWRPVYGYLDDEMSDIASSQYGRVRLQLKDGVKARATIAGEDTLNSGYYPVTFDDMSIAGWIPRRGYGERHLQDQVMNFITERESLDFLAPAGSGYNEVQVHGGLPVTDIESITFEGGARVDWADELVFRWAKEHGVSIFEDTDKGTVQLDLNQELAKLQVSRAEAEVEREGEARAKALEDEVRAMRAAALEAPATTEEQLTLTSVTRELPDVSQYTTGKALWADLPEDYKGIIDPGARGRQPSPETMSLVADGLSKVEDAGIDLGGLKVEFAGLREGRVGQYGFEDHKIKIDPKSDYWKNPAERAATLQSWNEWSDGSLSHPVVHEIGHALWDQQPHEPATSWTAPALRDFEDPWGVAMKVSRYAAKDPGEFVAETFAGMVNGRTFSDEVMRLYEALDGPTVAAREATAAIEGGSNEVFGVAPMRRSDSFAPFTNPVLAREPLTDAQRADILDAGTDALKKVMAKTGLSNLPTIDGESPSIGFVNNSSSPNSGWYDPDKNRVVLNLASPDWTDDARDPNLYDTGFVVGKTKESVIIHELGHMLNYAEVRKHWNEPGRDTSAGEADDWREIAMKVSRYAAKDPREFVAEVFAKKVMEPRWVAPPDVEKLYYDFFGPKVRRK